MPPRIFICYSWHDRRSAELLSDALEGDGYATWVDWRDLATGVAWESAVRQAMKECSLLLLVLTRSSSTWDQVAEACRAANVAERQVFTLCLDEDAAPDATLEPLINGVLWLDCFDQTLDERLPQVIAFVERLLPLGECSPKRKSASGVRRPPPAAEDLIPALGSLADRPGMFCGECGADNPTFAAECRSCGASMLLDLKSELTHTSCPVCTSINGPTARYCRVCGSSLDEPAGNRPASCDEPTEPSHSIAGNPLPPPASPSGSECVGQRAGQWLLTRLLGRGGQGTVYEVIHVFLRTPGALKLLHAGVGARGSHLGEVVRRGLRGLALLECPHVARILDFGEADFPVGSRHYLVAELVKGPRLSEILPEFAKPGAANFARALGIFRQLCQAVQAAHEVRYFDDAGFELIGMRHGDIKPANVLMASGDRVKLIDFLLFSAPDDGASADRTATVAHGTLGYMAPEQMEHGIVTIATDIYSLGATLLEMLTGVRPAEIGPVENGSAFRDALMCLNPDALACGDALRRCLALDPAHRYASVGDLLGTLPQL